MTQKATARGEHNTNSLAADLDVKGKKFPTISEGSEQNKIKEGLKLPQKE